jgi:transcription factor C subunit 6
MVATRKKAPKNYTTDPFAGIQKLLVASSDSGSDTSEAEPSEDEFDLQQATIAEAEEDEIVSPEALVPSSEDEKTVDGVVSEDDIAELEPTIHLGTPGKQHTVKRVPVGVDISDVHKLPAFDERGTKTMYHNVARLTRRGIPDVPHILAKESRVLYSVGPGTEDIAAHVRCRDKWIDQPTLPTRSSKRGNVGGLAYSFFHSKERRQKEATESWRWYYDQGCREIFSQEQIFNFSNSEESKMLMKRSLGKSDPFLMGPSHEPQLVPGLEPFEVFSTSTVWASGDKASKKNSWIFNAGAKVQCLDWAPNQSGLRQYLAVSTTSESTNLEDKDTPNAYTASSSNRMCLQIWEFIALGSNIKGGREIDNTKAPVLRFNISFGWGHLKRLKWCPILDEVEDVSDESTVRLGLLAGVWEDGKVRVLDLRFPRPEGTEPVYIHVSKAAFESKPPSTICTGIVWLSSTSIAASCSNGYVAIWNIADGLKSLSNSNQESLSNQRTTQNAIPWFYQSFHQGYIINIASTFPSRPQFLITKGIDGYTRLTDLRTPNQDTVLAPRDRVAQPHLLWHDASQTALSTDENYDLKTYALRLFYKSQAVGRVDALVTDLAGSPVHPFVLLGCASGSIWSMNPLKRLREHKKATHLQIWFKHEWRSAIAPPPQLHQTQPVEEDTVMQDAYGHNDETEPQQSTNSNTRPQMPKVNNILANPLIRFTEGYKLCTPDLSQHSRPNTTADDVAFVTIYEQKTAITKVCWNPNISCGTWAAAGMASGLVRVEDLAVD